MIKFKDLANNQTLELVQICFHDYAEPYLEKGVIGKTEEGRFFQLDFEQVEFLEEITREEITKMAEKEILKMGSE